MVVVARGVSGEEEPQEMEEVAHGHEHELDTQGISSPSTLARSEVDDGGLQHRNERLAKWVQRSVSQASSESGSRHSYMVPSEVEAVPARPKFGLRPPALQMPMFTRSRKSYHTIVELPATPLRAGR